MDKKAVTAGSYRYQAALPSSEVVSASLNLVGLGFDGTACFRKGASGGPTAIRKVSADIETYSPYLESDLEDIASFFDLGDLGVTQSGDVEEDWRLLGECFKVLTLTMDQSVRFLALGGEHSVSYFFIEKYLSLFPDLVLLHLDAHADLRDGYQGYHYSHASVIRRCMDHFAPEHQLAQFGIRSGTREEFDWMKSHGTRYTDLLEFVNYIRCLPGDRPVYLTLDLDYFDPSFMPGTGTPEPGGEDFKSFIEIIRVLRSKRMVGADVVELAPAIDPTGNSEVFATKVVREIILAFHGEDGHVR